MSNLILGIETSCDDTAIGIVDEHGNVISSVISSQIDIHNQFGGVYPEFAAREHILSIIPTIDETFKKSNIQLSDIKAIGVTRGPGLIGSLLVGINTAIGLGISWNKPVIGINHLRGHIRSADLEMKRVNYPATILLVSGGHTILAYMKSVTEIEILGSTKDDSVGETYDKVARMLDLGYPGGPIVDKLAKDGKATIPFPKPIINEGFDFSFSGLKSAVARYIEKNPDNICKNTIAASFVQSVLDVIITKSRKALLLNPSKSFIIVGGVAASPQIREQAQILCDELNVELCLPPLKWSTDNGAMIALATWDYIKYGIHKEPKVQLRLPLNEF